MKTCLHGPMDYSKTLKLRFRVWELDLPERREMRTGSREEEEDDAQMCVCGKSKERLELAWSEDVNCTNR